MDESTEPIEKKGSPSRGRKAHRGNSKKRGDQKSKKLPVRRENGGAQLAKAVGDLTSELEGTKKELKEEIKGRHEAEEKLAVASTKVALIEEQSANSLKIEGLKLDLWIGGIQRLFNWNLLLFTLAVVSLVPAACMGWAREAVLGVIGVAFVLLWPNLVVHEDSLGRRKVRMTAPEWFGWWVRSRPGSRHLKFMKFLDERHEDLRHDFNSLAKLKHCDAVYAVVQVTDYDEDISDEWTISLELLSQLLASKYMNPLEADDVQYDRIMRDAPRFHSVNISRYYRWTEHIYIATAHVAYAHAVHLKERTLGAFVLAPRPSDV